jgi:hypothetical protein
MSVGRDREEFGNPLNESPHDRLEHGLGTLTRGSKFARHATTGHRDRPVG